ncbi:hypothetical protein B296_00011570 [Ensete ventricosum]|uniref:Trehalose-phosphatase n=1 Tax=Ensete ventricosum TaxID=4639 RepID=A0A427A7J5_ENSVE|nr:hypothetical protein B296_00011570 [Ensete ventricosum]
MIGTWVESMKASSPTHTKAVPAIGAPVDEQSAAWIVSAVPHRFVSWLQSAGLLILLSSEQMRYPSALTKFEQITSASKGKQIVMFLDYDGTLSPIVEDPDSAFMTDAVNPSLFSYLLFHCPLLKDDISIVFLLLWRRQMRAAVRNVARYFPTAIVTGRCLEKVIDFVGLTELYYAGSHGMDIKGPAKPRHTKAKVYKSLLERTKSTAGAKVENNKFCVSVHFRCVEEKLTSFCIDSLQSWGALIEQVRSVLKEYPKLRLTQGRKVRIPSDSISRQH